MATGKYGFSEESAIVKVTSDGVDLNSIWKEVNDALSIYNEERSKLVSLLSYPTTRVADAVPQAQGELEPEEASEFGEPKSARVDVEGLKVGYKFRDYDLATRATWKYLRDADARQVEGLFAQIIDGFNRKTQKTILGRLFDPVQQENEFQNPVYGLYNGDGMIPPSYMGHTFDGTANHYVASGASVIDASDVEDAARLVTAKGYGRTPGSKLLLLVNPQEAERVRSWRAGEESRPMEGMETAGPIAKWDFIPSEAAPAYLLPDNIVGAVAPGQFNGLPVLGSYGELFVIQSEFVPAGFFAVVATGGPNSDLNPVAFRQHPSAAYQGLRLIPGPVPAYPLQESIFSQGFGVGVRHRGAAVCVQVTPGSTYTAPSILKWR
ncbi:hypothetical protein HYG77_21720 [Rhodococcus sp. ZPP]|uniref:hypothetical protein n=1 Tax=Rhodococcus sp. ZPP TaxID=2749906 RepID=UPI001AD896E3|nr:hypothetical protein [Rhodococcus sp. ZPP]QTJ67942.1 hypothetical protein HYG77_21720 [Rhodococcus sp. ZPP]